MYHQQQHSTSSSMQLLANQFPFAQQALVEEDALIAKDHRLPLIMYNNHDRLLLPQTARTWSNNALLPAPSIGLASLPAFDIISQNPNPSWVAQAVTNYEANNAFSILQRGHMDRGAGPYNVSDVGHYREAVMSSGNMHMLSHLQVKPEDDEAFNDSMKMGLNLGGRMYFMRDDVVSPLLRLGKRSRPNSLCIAQPVLCQVQGCKADLSLVKAYHRRHKVCQLHSKSAIVIVNGNTQRFCQQCSRFHGLSEFDEGKRSCRKRLADHNKRRRKQQPKSHPSYSATSDCTEASSIIAIATSTPISTTIAANFSTTISGVATSGVKRTRNVGNGYEEEAKGFNISQLKHWMTDNIDRVGKEQMTAKVLHKTNQVQQMQVYEGNLLGGSESNCGIGGLDHMGSLPWKLWSTPTKKGILPESNSNSNGLFFAQEQQPEEEECMDNLSLSIQNLVPNFASPPSPTLNASSSTSTGCTHDQHSSSSEWIMKTFPSAHAPPLEQLQPFINELPSTRQNHSQFTHYENQVFCLFDEERQLDKKVALEVDDHNIKTLSLQPWKLEAIANIQ